MALEHVLDHRHDRFRREARRVDLADALDPAGSLELEEQKVAAAEGGRRIADNEGRELGDFHRRRPPCAERLGPKLSWPGLSRPSTSWPLRGELAVGSQQARGAENRGG